MSMTKCFSDRVAVVIGGTRGIGLASGRLLAAAGSTVDVLLLDRRR